MVLRPLGDVHAADTGCDACSALPPPRPAAKDEFCSARPKMPADPSQRAETLHEGLPPDPDGTPGTKTMDRPLPALASLLAVLLLVIFGLAVFTASHTDTPPSLPNEQVYDLAAAPQIPAVQRVASRPRYHVPHTSPPVDWLPSLSDGTRTVLAEFALDEQPVEAPESIAAGPPLPAEVGPGEIAPPKRFESDGKLAADGSAPAEVIEPSPVEITVVEPAAEAEPETADAEPLQADLLLMPAHDGSRRSHELELIARQADAHTQYGFELAGRAAYFSARAEFTMALRLVAQGLDAEYRTDAHVRTLAAGLTALAEAEDFVPRGSGLEAHLDLAATVRSHRTPILKGTATDRLTALDAMQSYLTFAQEQLSYAAGGEIAGSMALYGLGKLHKKMAEQMTAGVRATRPKAVVFYQASLLVSPRNYMASNDLGVMLCQSGRYEDGRGALEHSVSICPQAAGWHNLAVAYRQTGKNEAARRATLLAQASRSEPSGQVEPSAGAVRWVDPYAFAQAAGQTLATDPPVRAGEPAERPTAASPPKQAAGWLPWKTSDARK